MGLNDTSDRKVFTDVPNITGVKQITCGWGHTILLMNDGNIKACGYNGVGQLGLNITTNTKVFADVTSAVEQISCGWNHTMIFMGDGNY